MRDHADPRAPAVPTTAQVEGGVRGTYVAFTGAGLAFASWAARIPQVRDHLDLSAAQLGLVLFAIAAGSLVALPLSGPWCIASGRLARSRRWPCCSPLP